MQTNGESKHKKILDEMGGKPPVSEDQNFQKSKSFTEKQGFVFVPFSSFWRGKVKGMQDPVQSGQKNKKGGRKILLRLWIRFENWKENLWKNEHQTQTFVNESNSTLNGLFKKLGKKNQLHLHTMQVSVQVNLGQYINDLLFEHNCVIVPELGGFISRRVTAQLNHVAHKISPPGKKIAFNQGLNVNDGLLAQTISNQEGITFEQAVQVINNLVINLRQQLYNERTVHLDKIGHFYIDQDEVLSFHPEVENNFDKQTYGLSTIQAIPVVRDGHEKLKRKIKARVQNRRPINQQISSKKSNTVRRVVANTLLIVFVFTLSFASVMVNTDQKASLFNFEWNHLFGTKEISKNNSSEITLNSETVAQMNLVGFDKTGKYILVLKSFSSMSEASEFSTGLNEKGLKQAKPCYKENGKVWVGVCRTNQEEQLNVLVQSVNKTYTEAKIVQK